MVAAYSTLLRLAVGPGHSLGSLYSNQRGEDASGARSAVAEGGVLRAGKSAHLRGCIAQRAAGLYGCMIIHEREDETRGKDIPSILPNHA